MAQPAIAIENLSKRYKIGSASSSGFRYRTLREAISNAAAAPIRRLRRLGSAEDCGRTIWALKGVSLRVQPGEILGIIGRNGAGKSTLLKILSRVTQPTLGTVAIRGRVASLLEVGTGFHPELTGRENIYLNGSVLGMTRREIQRKFDEIVAFAEVERFVDTPVKRFSSGMYLRLAFAVAAHLDPEILVVDEVLAVGDAEFQKKCLGKMGGAATEGRTVILVSHNMAAIEQLCRRTVLVRAGEIQADGPTQPVIADYLNDAIQSDQGEFDLSEHSARAPRRTPVIRRLILKGSDGTARSQFCSLETLEAHILIQALKPIREPRVALAIEDQHGRRITTVASYFYAESLRDIAEPCWITCTIPRIPLGTGRYLVSLSIGTKQDGLLDSIDNIAWFEVISQNTFGNGEPYYPVYGPVLTRSVWQRSETALSANDEVVWPTAS